MSSDGKFPNKTFVFPNICTYVLYLVYFFLFSTSAHRSVDGRYHGVVHQTRLAAVACKNERRTVDVLYTKPS